MPRIYYSVFLLLLCCFLSHAQVTSTFDTSLDGWTVTGNVTLPTFLATGGNPGGLIVASDNETGFTPFNFWYWNAPSKFVGNKTLSYGLNLRFDLQQSVAGVNNTLALVQISNGSTTLYYFPATLPAVAPAWTSYAIKLDEISTGWKTSNSSTGTAATKLQIKTVLSNIVSIAIRGEFNANNVADTGGLDNVVLESLPTGGPLITSFTPTAGIPLTTNITITGSNFSSIPGNNVIYFGSTQATIVSETATQLVVTTPRSASYGPITVINKTTNRTGQSQQPFNPIFAEGGRIIPASFSTPTQMLAAGTPAGNNIVGTAAGDLDGDGWPELLFSESGSNTVSVFRNLAAGGDISTASFATKISLTGAGNSNGMKTLDVDGDGKLDILTSYSDGFVMQFATYRNTSTPGNLSFETVELWPCPVYSGILSDAVDVDGDGRIDMIGQHGNGSASPDFWISQNISTPGNIEFGFSVSYFGSSTLDAGAGASYGDLNNDGKPEMLVGHGFGGNFSILPNTSTPGVISFGTAIPMSQGLNGRVLVADFNLDGKNDIAWKYGSATEDVKIRINTNSGGALAASDFSTEVVLNTDLTNYGSISIGDYNGDGKPDILANDATSLGVFENVYSGGAFNSSAFIPAFLVQGAGGSTYPESPIPCDLNGDSKPEIIMPITNTSPDRVLIYQNKNVHAPVIALTTVSPLKGPVGSTVTITGNYFSTIPTDNVVKFGGGIQASVLSATKTSLTVSVPAGASYGPVSVTRNELTSFYHLPFDVIYSAGRTIDATSFSTPVDFLLTTAGTYVQAADLNSDGKIDIVADGLTSRSYTFRNTHVTGAITTSSLTADDTTSSTALSPTLVDLNGDGKLDMATNAGLYRNTTSGTEISFDNVVNISNANNMGTADFNLDGKIDFCGISGSVYIYENRATPGPFLNGTYASVSTPFFISAGGTTSGTAAADFDNDGLTDIAFTVFSSIDYIAFYRNVGGGRISNPMFTSGQSINTLDLPERVYEADLDVDGKMDFMIYHQAGGTNGNMISVFHNQSSGPGNVNFVQTDYTLGAITGVAGTVGGPSAIADLDGDGKPELIITSTSTTAARQGFYVFKNNSTPGTINASSFTSSGLIPLTGARSVAAADINFDSKPDLVFTRTGNLLSILQNVLPGIIVTIDTQPGSNSVCSGGAIVLGVAASGEPGLQYQWQRFTGATFTDISNDATYSGATTTTLTISNLTATTTYRVRASGTFAVATSNNAIVTVNAVPAAPGTTGNTGCSGASVTVSASGSTNGNYRWYSAASGGLAIAGEVNSTFNTPNLTSTTSYYAAISNGTCESTRVAVVATINAVSPPTATGATGCESGVITLSAGGGTNGNYRWYSIVSGGTAIPGAVNSSFTTPPLSVTTTYYVTLSNGTCESNRVSVLATIKPRPSKPTITSIQGQSLPSTLIICAGTVELMAPNGFNCLWSNGATTPQITVTTDGTFTVQIIDAGCTSFPSDPITVVFDSNACNSAPEIFTKPLTTVISGNVSLTLSEIIKDAENNFDNVLIVSQPISGATVTIVNGVLKIDYSKTSFSGTDQFVIRACDTRALCSEDVTITIEVIGEVEVFNAVSPNGDGLNEFLRFEHIEVLERTRNNKVTILNRWGDKVFEVSNYDNKTRVFKGANSNGTELPSGTYFYKIEFTGPNAPPMKTGYFALKR